MLDAIKSWIPLIVAVVAFCIGVSYGTSKTEAKWKDAENQQLIAYKNQISVVLKGKDEKISQLLSDLSSARKSNSDIVRKLDTYKARERTLAECRNDRARMADVAVGLDDFAQRLVTRTRSMIK